MQALIDSTFFPADMSPWVANLIILFAKGILVLSATWIMAYALRRSAAAIRFMVWCTGVLSLMLLPLLSTVLPGWQLEFLPAATTSTYIATAPITASGSVSAPDQLRLPPAPFPERAGSASSDGAAVVPAPMPAPAENTSFFASLDYHWSTWAFMIWVLGVVILSVRLTLAHAGAALLIRKSELVHDEDWHLMSEHITQQLGIDHFVRLRKSQWTSVPMSVGIFKSTVVLPENADEWDENQRKTVLFHELAHVKRKDCLLQLLTQITAAIYWFNPLVWIAAWQLRIERERACDDLVITSGIDASSYAETLLETARRIKKSEWSTLATVSMARQSQLEGRLLSILDPMRRRNLNRATVVLTVSMIACLVVPLAIMQPARAQEAPAPPPAPHGEVDGPETDGPEILFPEIVIPEIVIPEINIPEIVIPEIEIPEIHVPEIHVPELNIEIPPIHIPDMEFDFDAGSSDEADQTPVDSLTIEQLIQLRKYGVDAGFIQGIKALGFQDITYGDLMKVAKYGAGEDYIQRMRQAGYDGLSLSEYAAMSKYGVDPAFVASMERAGYTELSASELISMSKYGVDEELVDVLITNGYDDLSVEDIVAASKYGVDAELITSLRNAGYTDFTIDEVISAQKYGVGEALIQSMRNYGYTGMAAEELITSSKYGVDAEFMETLKAYGYSGLPLEQVISMKKYGVDDQYLAEMGETGLEADVEELISMRKYGVDAQFVKEIMEAGLEEVSIDQLIDMRKHGVDAEYIRSMREN